MAESTTASSASEEAAHRCGCKSSSKAGTPAREILDRRYASGEINRDQYQQMKQDLGGEFKGEKSNKGCC